jgi:hypothetical protein
MYLDLDVGDATPMDVGNFLVGEVASRDQGEDVAILIAEPCHGSEKECRLLVGEIAFLLAGTLGFSGFGLFVDKMLFSTLVIVKEVAADGKQQFDVFFPVLITFKIAGKALLDQVGGEVRAAGLAEKIGEELVAVINIKLVKPVHSSHLTYAVGKGYNIFTIFVVGSVEGRKKLEDAEISPSFVTFLPGVR